MDVPPSDVQYLDDASVVSSISDISMIKQDIKAPERDHNYRRNLKFRPDSTITSHPFTGRSFDMIPGIEWVGYQPRWVYCYREPITESSGEFLTFLEGHKELLADLGIPLPSVNLLDSEFRPPTVEDFYKHVARFGSGRPSGQDFCERTMGKVFSKLSSAEDTFPSITNWLLPHRVYKVTLDKTKSPGIYWKKEHYANKGEAQVPACRAAAQLIENLIRSRSDYVYPTTPCSVGGRGKLAKPNKVYEKDGRLILIPDLVHHLIGSLGSKSYFKALNSTDRSKGGIMLGMGPFMDHYEKLITWSGDVKFWMMIDFSGFDQTVPAILIRKAFEVISDKFSSMPGKTNYFNSQYKHLAETEIVLPYGAVYRKKRGVASGDPWTSVVGSYANWIAIQYCMLRLGIGAKLWTFGDDSLIAIKSSPFSKDEIMSRIAKCLYDDFGMEVSISKSFVSDRIGTIGEPASQLEKSPQFLSMFFVKDSSNIVRPWRPIEDMYEHMIHPEKYPSDTELKSKGTSVLVWEIERTVMDYIGFYWNEHAKTVLRLYYNYLMIMNPLWDGDMFTQDLAKLYDIPRDHFRYVWVRRFPRDYEILSLFNGTRVDMSSNDINDIINEVRSGQDMIDGPGYRTSRFCWDKDNPTGYRYGGNSIINKIDIRATIVACLKTWRWLHVKEIQRAIQINFMNIAGFKNASMPHKMTVDTFICWPFELKGHIFIPTFGYTNYDEIVGNVLHEAAHAICGCDHGYLFYQVLNHLHGVYTLQHPGYNLNHKHIDEWVRRQSHKHECLTPSATENIIFQSERSRHTYTDKDQ
jgi:hypothetical protein